MLYPICLPIPIQFSYHVHQQLVSSFHLSIGLNTVRQSPNLLYAHKLTKLSNNVAYKVGSLVTQELHWGSEDKDVTLPQKLSNSFYSLIRGHIHYDVFSKVSAKDQTIQHVWGLILLHHCLNAGKVNVQQLQRSGNNDGSHWGFGMSAFMLDTSLTAANHLLHLSSHTWPPELVMQQAQYLLLALVSSIMVTSIHGSYPVSLGDYE